jgi:hypothetical protein
MRDRLKSIKLYRAMRNLFFLLSAVCLLEACFLFFNTIFGGHHFIIQGVIFIILTVILGFVSYYYHSRFRCRD